MPPEVLGAAQMSGADTFGAAERILSWVDHCTSAVDLWVMAHAKLASLGIAAWIGRHVHGWNVRRSAPKGTPDA